MDIKPFIVGKETTEEELKVAMDDFKTVLAQEKMSLCNPQGCALL